MAVTVHRYNQTAKLFLNKEISLSTIKGMLLNSARTAAFDATHTSMEQALGGRKATVTITIATPGVVTDTAHGYSNGQKVSPLTTGALPTGLATGIWYYVVNQTANTYQLSLTSGGSAINTTGTQSGVHTMYSDGVGQVSGNNWTDGGETFPTVVVAVRSTSGAALTVGDVRKTATGADIGPAYGVLLYDSTTMNVLWLDDFGQAEQAGQETDFLLVFDPTGTRGTVLTLT